MTLPATPTNTTAQPQSVSDDQIEFSAALKLREHLEKVGMKEEDIDFMIGAFIGKVVERTTKEVLDAVGSALINPDVVAITDETMRQKKVEELFKNATGKTVAQHREQVANQMLSEFEALETV